jgi:hypothetical protein
MNNRVIRFFYLGYRGFRNETVCSTARRVAVPNEYSFNSFKMAGNDGHSTIPSHAMIR